MNSNKNLWIAVVVVAIIAIFGAVVPKGKTIVNQVKEKTVGAVSTLDGVDNPYVSIGGKREYHYNQPVAATSSVVCSLANPFPGRNALLLSYGFSATTTPAGAGGLGNQVLDLATSTTAYGTSSPAFFKEATANLVAGQTRLEVQWLPQATTTNTRIIGMEPTGTMGFTNAFIGPSEYLNLRVSTTSSSGTFSTYYTGNCSAVLREI